MRTSTALTMSIAVLACVGLAGCTKYEFVITAPPEFAGRLTKQERVIEREPVTYYFVDQSSRVGIRLENISDAAITVKGEESYVVTPDGQSTPVHGGTIAANSWTGVTIPPLVTVYSGGGGVSFGLGVGTWGHSGGGGIGVGYSPWYDGFYAPSDELAWRWKEGSVHVHLVIEKTSDPSARVGQDFTIERRRVE